MSTRRRSWLKRAGLVVLLLLLAIGGLVIRYQLHRAEHKGLRDQELTRAPVVAPRRPNAANWTPTAPTGSACIRGVVLDRDAPVSGMQVSLSDSPLSVSGDCPCIRPANACWCREGLQLIPTLARAGLAEAVQSVTTDATGRFELCGLGGEGLRLLWGEHLDGRVALTAPERSPMVKPGDQVELRVLAPVPVQGVVLADQAPVANATVWAFSTPQIVVRTFITDARGRFEATLLPGTSDFVVSAKGFPVQRVDQQFTRGQALVLQLKGESQLTVRALFEDRPVAGAEVEVSSEPTVLTDAQGVARFALQIDPRFQVRVTKGDLLGESAVRLLEGAPRRIDVVLTKGLRVKGVVTDEQGKPRAARVRGLGKGVPMKTDDAGRFTSGLVAKGSFSPVASAEGCADSEYRSIEVGEGDLTLKLSCTESANGVVLDAEGKPVESASVILESLDHRESALTEADGRFAFHQPKGTYQLRVMHERYRTQEQPLQLPAKDVTIVLDAGGSISGRVVDGAGAGVAEARVTIVPAVLGELLAEVEGGNTRATTDAEGHFEVIGLLAGRLVASATADSQGTVVSEAIVLQPGEHRQGLVLKLDEQVDLQGVVLDEQRRPIPGARVKWDPADEKSALMSVMLDAVRGRVDQVLKYLPSPSVTDLDGHYVLKGLPISKVKVSVRAASFAEVEQVASKGETLDFTLKREGGRIRGRVVDEAGKPLPRFAVDGASFTPDDGRFEVESYSGEDTLSIDAAGFSRQSVHVVLEGATKDLGDVTMKKGHQLRVEARADGKPLEGVKVAAAQSVDGDSCTTKADGRCMIEPLLDVSTSVKAEKDGYVPASVTLAPGQVDQLLTLTLSPAGGRIIGEAYALPGRPAPGRSVFISGAVSKGVMADEAGHFVAEGLPEGAYCASLDSASFRGAEWAVPAQANAAPVAVQVGPVTSGGNISGARTLPGRLVLVRGARGPLDLQDVLDKNASALCEAMATSVIATITTGDFRVEGVPPGRWSVFFVSFTQEADKGTVSPTVIDLLPNETKSL